MSILSCTEQTFLSWICDWLEDGTTPDDLLIVKDSPWARTYRLTGSKGERYLKCLPPEQRGTLIATSRIAALFPDVIPQVMKVDPELGLLLMAGHGGVDHKDKGSLASQQKTLATYAAIQSKACKETDLLTSLPTIQLNQLVSDLLVFLNPNASLPNASLQCNQPKVTARDFLEVETCQYYFELFTTRAEKLKQLVAEAELLPLTLNHCDLRPSNFASKENGDLVIYDWDEAVPARQACRCTMHFQAVQFHVRCCCLERRVYCQNWLESACCWKRTRAHSSAKVIAIVNY